MFNHSKKLQDEIARLQEENRLYRETIGRIASQASTVGVQVVDSAGNVDDVNKRVVQLAAEMDNIRQISDEMAAQNQNVGEATSHAKEVVGQTRQEVGQSLNSIEESLDDISRLTSLVTGMQTQLSDVNTALERVRKVANSITAVAKQTNLLALNATIEASRAGEAGRGFAVVAEEVKELAKQTGEATGEIDITLKDLTTKINRLIQSGDQSTQSAQTVQNGTEQILVILEAINSAMSNVDQHTNHIADSVGAIDQSITHATKGVNNVAEEFSRSTENLNVATDRLNDLTAFSERLVQETVVEGITTYDTEFITLSRQGAEQVMRAFEAALDRGEISEQELFDRDYQLVAGTNPEQFMVQYIEFVDRILPEIQEPLVSDHERVLSCAAVDINGYLPTHLRKWSKPQTDDVAWNTANSRNRRILNDRVGLAAGQNTKPFLVQTYRRDMGAEGFVLMKDASTPIFVRGRHWGGFRLNYAAN